jgi:hypothetical protein
LINALLGANLLPANVTPTTALLTLIKYGKEVEIDLIPFHGAPQRVSPDVLAETLSLSNDEEENHRRQATYKMVEVHYPSSLLENNVEIVDSPGLNESAMRTEITSGYIRQSDAAIFVLSATNFASMTELEYLNSHILGKGLTHIFFAINQYDRVIDDADDPVVDTRDMPLPSAAPPWRPIWLRLSSGFARCNLGLRSYKSISGESCAPLRRPNSWSRGPWS